MVVSHIFYFHLYLGKWSNLTDIFEMGWNHQLKFYRISKWMTWTTYISCTPVSQHSCHSYARSSSLLAKYYLNTSWFSMAMLVYQRVLTIDPNFQPDTTGPTIDFLYQPIPAIAKYWRTNHHPLQRWALHTFPKVRDDGLMFSYL